MDTVWIQTLLITFHERDIVFELIIELIFFITTTREMNNLTIYKIT
jgi:hypothetical protein